MRAAAAGQAWLDELVLRGPARPWERLGLALDADRTARVGSVRLRFAGGEGGGIAEWALRGLPPGADLDGLPTRAADAPAGKAADPPSHPLGAIRVDHVVVMTPDLARTFAALEAAGLELRRVREAGGVRQGFYRLGETILEVVGDVPGDARARFWGLVLVVDDLDTAAARLGDRLGRVKDAVQPGRRIATVREQAELGLPVALITP